MHKNITGFYTWQHSVWSDNIDNNTSSSSRNNKNDDEDDKNNNNNKYKNRTQQELDNNNSELWTELGEAQNVETHESDTNCILGKKGTTLAFLLNRISTLFTNVHYCTVYLIVCFMEIFFYSGLSGSWAFLSLYLSAPWDAKKQASSRLHSRSLNEALYCLDWGCLPAIVSFS